MGFHFVAEKKFRKIIWMWC